MRMFQHSRMKSTLFLGMVLGALVPPPLTMAAVTGPPRSSVASAAFHAGLGGGAREEGRGIRRQSHLNGLFRGKEPRDGKARGMPDARDTLLVAQSEPSEAPRTAPRIPSGVKVNFDFQDYDLEELVHRVSEMFQRNFILTESLSGKKVTIISPTKITIDEAYQVFLSVLRTSGYTVVPIGKSLKIVPLASISTEGTPIETESIGNTEEFVTRLFRVENIDVEQITGALTRLVNPNGSIISYAPTNTLIITDTARNVERVIDIIAKLDVESPTEQLVIIPIRYAPATDIADKIMQVYGDEGASSARSSTSRKNSRTRRNSARRRNRKSPSQASSSNIGEDTPKISKIIADERTNSLIILATDRALADIQALVAKLDVDVDEALKSDIHVVHLKFAKAEELAGTLANLAGGGSSRSSRNSRNARTRNTRTSSRNKKLPSRGGTGESAVATFEGGVRITADPPTNSLVITASYNDYRTLRSVIDRLDIRRKQVFVEAVILELSQSKDKDLGLSYHGGVPGDEEGAGALFARGATSLLLNDPALLSGLAVGVFGASIEADSNLASALSTAFGVSSDSLEIPAFGLVLQALQQDSDVNILSTPSILTSNNQEAKIVVGQNVPFQSGSTISTIGSNISITREDVALTLRVTPQVNYSNEVTLEVFQEITEVVPATTDNPLGPTTTKRSAETVVSVPDNQTVVIGGLIQAKENVAETKVPILGDIPLIGVLFRTRSTNISKANLLIFLTPHIIDDEVDLQNVYRVKMAQRQEFIRRFYGRSREEQLKELESLLQYSMNLPEREKIYPDKREDLPMETTIETYAPERGFTAPIPGSQRDGDGPVVVPVVPRQSSGEGGDAFEQGVEGGNEGALPDEDDVLFPEEMGIEPPGGYVPPPEDWVPPPHDEQAP